jgi:starch synthase
MSRIKALSVASEVYPLIKTGGLADVAGALPVALKAEGVDARTLVPAYPAVLAGLEDAAAIHEFADLFGGPASLLAGRAHGLDLLALHAPHLFSRPGNPYTGPDGADWPDNAFRFAALARAAADIGLNLVPAVPAPDLIHAHDWQAGLTPAYLRYDGRPRPGVIMTVHNLAFQGQFPYELLAALKLPPESYAFDGVEYYGAIGYLKAGLQLADRITTVSPNYAVEILGPEAGMGMDGLLRSRASLLSGIINGVDDSVWDPSADPRIAAPYTAQSLEKRAVNKAALQERLGLKPDPDALLFGAVTRLSWQKGIDLLLETLPVALEGGFQLALLGAGDAGLEAALLAASRAHPEQVGVQIGYDENFAHLIQAGSDALLVPSRFEPCGLTQLCALRYGAAPVVSRVGGLVDTIIDATEMALASSVATGVQFGPVTSDALAQAIRKTAALFRDKAAWRQLQLNGMATDVSWRYPARRYARLYRELAAARKV